MRISIATLLTGILAISCSAGRKSTSVCEPSLTQACSGPGACKGGQRCLPDGLGWGACDCGDAGSGVTDVTSIAVAIGPDGGVVQVGDARLEVPRGALSQTVTINMRSIASSSPVVFGSIYEFMPDGLAFAVPATLIIRIDSTGSTNDASLTDVRIATSVDGVWVALPSSSVDPTGNERLALIAHFTYATAGVPVGAIWIQPPGYAFALPTDKVSNLPAPSVISSKVGELVDKVSELKPCRDQSTVVKDCAPDTYCSCYSHLCWCAGSNSSVGISSGGASATETGGATSAGGTSSSVGTASAGANADSLGGSCATAGAACGGTTATGAGGATSTGGSASAGGTGGSGGAGGFSNTGEIGGSGAAADGGLCPPLMVLDSSSGKCWSVYVGTMDQCSTNCSPCTGCASDPLCVGPNCLTQATAFGVSDAGDVDIWPRGSNTSVSSKLSNGAFTLKATAVGFGVEIVFSGIVDENSMSGIISGGGTIPSLGEVITETGTFVAARVEPAFAGSSVAGSSSFSGGASSK